MQDALPEEALRATERLQWAMDVRQRELVLMLREQGVSWDLIAVPIGITRQALQRRYARWTRNSDHLAHETA